MIQIIDNLYIGDIHDASDEIGMREIFAVVNCIDDSVVKFPDTIYHPALCMGDRQLTGVDMEKICSSTGNFIHKYRMQGVRVLVHCRHGVSRSATVIIAYLIGYCGMTFNEAYKTVNDKKSILPYEYDFLSAYKRKYK